MRPFHRFIAPLVLVVAAGCAAVNDPTGSDDALTSDVVGDATVQMNDVSVMYPLVDSAEEADGYTSPWDEALGGPLLPESVFRSATEQPASSLVGAPLPQVDTSRDAFLDYGALRAISFRIDPCAAHIGAITDAESCDNQLRLVFQSLYVSEGKVNASDHAVHAIYSLSRSALVDLVSELTALRKAQGRAGDLGPIAIHPLLVQQGMNGGYAKGLRKILAKYAGQKNLAGFARFTSEAGHPIWHFSSFTVDGSGTLSPLPIPTAPNGATTVNFASAINGAPSDEPIETTSPDNVSVLTHVPSAQLAPKAAQEKAFESALRVLNPDIHSPKTIDCVSCHVAGRAFDIATGPLGIWSDESENLFTFDPTFIPEANLDPTTDTQIGGARNLHMFGYLGRDARIDYRVINETAVVVAYLNGEVFAR